MSAAVRYAAGAVIAREGGGRCCLLLRRRPGGGCWQLPKRHLRSGESVWDAAVRAAEEQAGCTVALVRYVEYLGATSRHNGRLVHTRTLYFLARPTEKRPHRVQGERRPVTLEEAERLLAGRGRRAPEGEARIVRACHSGMNGEIDVSWIRSPAIVPPARLGLASLPVPAALDAWQRRVDLVASLVTWTDLGTSLSALHREIVRRGIGLLDCLSIPDLKTPTDIGAADQAILGIARCLRDGQTVVTHCLAGRGRSGLVAASILVALGEAADMAIDHVRAGRPGALRRRGQVRWVQEFEKRLAEQRTGSALGLDDARVPVVDARPSGG